MPDFETVLGAVDAWFDERLAKGPIAHHVPSLRQARLAVHDETGLKARLATVFGPGESTQADEFEPDDPASPADIAKLEEPGADA